MNVLFIGGDKRYLTIIRSLEEKKYNIDLLGYSDFEFDRANKLDKLELKKYDFIVLPMSGISNDYRVKSLDGELTIEKDIFEEISKTTVFTGLITDPILDVDEKISFLSDKEVKDTNSDITVDGILDDIKDKNKSLICILGYGNIGKRLYQKLKDEYIVIVGIKEGEQYDDLKFKAFYTNDKEYFKRILNFSTIIINTVPSNIIDDTMIDYIKGYFLDIASYPYGIKPELTGSINYRLYSGIPGSYNPEESGKILLKKIDKVIGG